MALINDGIYSLEQFGKGFNLGRLPRLAQERQWEQWYNGRYETLLPKPNLVNGLGFFEIDDLITYPFFKISSDFYTEATIAEQPSVSTDEDSIKDWMEEKKDVVFDAMRRAVRWWSIKGRLVMVTHEDGAIEAVDPSAYFRVGTIYTPDHLTGHIIAYPYYQPMDGDESKQGNQSHVANRIRVIKYREGGLTDEGVELPEVNTIQIFQYSGQEIGDPLTPEVFAGITSVCVAGQADGWYQDAKRVVAQYMIRLTNNERVKNKSDNRPLYLPNGFLLNVPIGKPMTPQEQLNSMNNIVNPVVSVSKDDAGNIGFIGDTFDFAAEQAGLEYLAQLGYIITGLPITSWGVNIGAGESGFAREKAQDRAGARIRSLRQELSRCLPVLVRGMGAPEGEVTFSWNTSPFEDRTAKTQELLNLLGAGVMTREEVRNAIGLDEIDEEEEPENDNDDSDVETSEEEDNNENRR